MFKDLRILIVDDEIIIARDLERIVRRTGLEKIEIANSSKEALDLMNHFVPHLILCDINLEEKENDGISLSEKIIEVLECQIIFVTAHSNKEIVERASKINPLNYIIKPFEEEQIKVILEIAMNQTEIQNGGIVKINYKEILTESEYKIIKHIIQNKSSKQIAEDIFISAKTVENHRANIIKKLNLKSEKNSLLKWALQHKEYFS